MKKIVFALAMVTLAACGTANNSTMKAAPGADIQGNGQGPDVAPAFSCSLESVAADNYKLAIDVYEATMNVLQSSNTARYAPLKYSIVKNDSLGIPDQAPKFSCSKESVAADNYRLTIEVFEDRIIILQSSNIARFAPLKYSITPVKLKD